MFEKKAKNTSFVQNIGVFFCFLVLGFISVVTLNPIGRSDASSRTVTENAGSYVLSMSNDSDVVINITPTSSQATYTGSNDILFTNTCPAGASISVSTANDYSELISATGNTVAATEVGSELSNNSWGFSLDEGITWANIPTISENTSIIYSLNSIQSEAMTIPILFGIRIDHTLPSGSYMADVVYTIIPSQDCYGTPIVWDANNGTNPEGLPTTVNADGTINLSLLPRPTRQYYLFAGWSNGTTTFTGDETAANINPTGAPSITMTTLWTPEPFAISYTMNGGSATNATSYTIESGAITLTNPTRSYYTFKGWSGTGLTGDTNTTVTIPAGSTGARSYTANWTPVNYTITYTLNGGSASNPTTYNIETATFTLNNPTRSGLSFSGWSGTGLSGSANKTVTIAQGSVGNRSYTANWAPTTTVWNYGYTGGMQSFSVPATGTYKLEVWGAQGGSVSGAAGGKGGYAVGNKALTAGQVLYIGVGGQNTDFNGGSSYSGRSAAQDNFDNAAKGGGGGSHFGLTNTQISATSKTNLLVVAGGGGGGIWTIFYVGPTTYYGAGGAGGGTSGSAGAANGYSGGYSYVGGGGGTQSAGGSQAAWTSNSDCLPARYAGYGVGGVAHKTCWQGVGGGGGGGYYGGGAGYNGGGGGGSSYTGGVTSGSTTANQRTGNGYARVTWVGN